MVWKVDWRVLADGRDMTAAMRPFLISVSISDKDGTAGDTCQLQFDAAGGQITLPQNGGKVQVYLEGVNKFDGVVDSVRFALSRGGGRTLNVGAKGFDANGPVKQPQSFHMDDGSLQQFLDKAAKTAGLSGIQIDPSFAAITRNYWSAEAESFLHLGQKLARDLGGTFKIRGERAVLAKRGTGIAPSGVALPPVIGIVGQNVIGLDIEPISTRDRFKTAAVRYFDRAEAVFKTIRMETDDERARVDRESLTIAADENQARMIAEGRKADSKREGGGGSVTLDLDVTAQPEAPFILQGAYPRVDGTYRIASVTNKADRSGGSTTSLELKEPGDGTGKDGRTVKAPAGADEGDDYVLPKHATLG
ncbi:late control D family protein [Devosia sp. SD17-2]|uniref:phage late control D family protein n=1 Tax=Devosia sp. SD17-2 TaxID=2976459 RepID=UPI0023D80ED9|nr:late control D family protein [Devosia sp. SD17-2]WEJ33850.1 late control D family protein [Devosia sp. SD17-2]